MKKNMNQLALALAALLLAGMSQAQTAPTNTSAFSSSSRETPTLRDNPGVLGHTYADLSYSWVDFHRDSGLDADGFIAGLNGNSPIARGIDLGLGYNYYRENNHRNPFTGTPYDARYHEVATRATFYTPTSGNMKPFVSGGVGYQWSRGDLQALRTFDHEWTWMASGGVEAIMGSIVLTPRVSYVDTMRSHSIGSWQYGAQVHHWFSEKTGGYLDATFRDPLNGGGRESWTYTAGMRFRF